MKTKTNPEPETEMGEDPYTWALRAPCAGSPAFVSVFVFVLILIPELITLNPSLLTPVSEP